LKASELYRLMGVSIDLAVEAHALVRGETGREVPGVKEDKQQFPNAVVTTVQIMDPAAEKIMGKPIGTYITIEAPEMRANNPEVHQDIGKVLAEQLQKLVKIGPEATVLVVGLGNWNATPDALGPKAVESVIVSRHLHKYAPQAVVPGLRPVCAFAPGVLGITGIETAEIIKGVVDRVRPDLVIAIDALAARSADRIGMTLQLADTGISPGSGVGNVRAGISQSSMGVPVIAIGVPTVVDAAVIAHDAIEALFNQYKGNPLMAQTYQGLQTTDVQGIIANVLQPFEGHLMVTPKEIDDLIQRVSIVLAGGINQALHPTVHADDLAAYVQ